MTVPQNVLIICDEALVASALSNLLSSDPRLNVVASGASAKSNGASWARECAGFESPVIVYDVGVQLTLAAECIFEITSSSRAPVIAVAPADSFESVPPLLEAGARGIVGRDAGPDELIAAVNEVAAGHVFASRLMLRQMLDHVARRPRARASDPPPWEEMLAPRECDVVRLLTRGMTNREIATSLHLSEATVKAHLGRVMTKWKVRDRLQVALHAIGCTEEAYR